MKLIKQGEQEGRRCAVVGLYTDRMAMSVMQRGEQGSFCLYRRQWEGELLDQQGELDVERLAGVADSLRRLAQKLCCEEVHFCGYGLLRYRQGLREELEQKLGCPVQMVSGLQQARAASLGLFGGQSVGRGAAGIYSGDLSTQFFGTVGWRQSVPLGWRALWKQGEGLIPNRVQEEQLRRTARELLARGGVHSNLPTPRIDARGGAAGAAVVWCRPGHDGLPGERKHPAASFPPAQSFPKLAGTAAEGTAAAAAEDFLPADYSAGGDAGAWRRAGGAEAGVAGGLARKRRLS